ncbi:MAG: hypothetical protein ABIG60_00715 [Patescibacteria group bacterium]
MIMPGYEDLLETDLKGLDGSNVKIKIGEEFIWINHKVLGGTTATTSRRMIEEYGAGPFLLKKITLIPAGYILLVFDDKHGQERKISYRYFKKC